MSPSLIAHAWPLPAAAFDQTTIDGDEDGVSAGVGLAVSITVGGGVRLPDAVGVAAAVELGAGLALDVVPGESVGPGVSEAEGDCAKVVAVGPGVWVGMGTTNNRDPKPKAAAKATTSNAATRT
jgi:acetyltransferase-like isoleucine patch superfamily enzyme